MIVALLIAFVEIIVAALVAGLFLWILRQFPELDAMIARIVRVAIVVIFAVVVICILLQFVPSSGVPPLFRR